VIAPAIAASTGCLLALGGISSCGSPSSSTSSDAAPDTGGPDVVIPLDSPDEPDTKMDVSAPDVTDAGDASDATDGSQEASPGTPHVVFVTNAGFTGDLVGAANALVADGGIPSRDASFAATDWQAAGDALCQHAAAQGGLPSGNYWALISGHEGANPVDAFARIQDSDGPWALVDGTPVADTVADLSQGNLRASIDETELGAQRSFSPFDPAAATVWTGTSGADCNGWASASGPDGGFVPGKWGSYRTIWVDYLGVGLIDVPCTSSLPIYCAQVAPGAGPNVKSAVPSGGKVVFATTAAYHGDFAASWSAAGDGGVDSIHGGADAICNAEAAGKLTGTFRAWISSPAMSAADYFTANSMNGPWYRPDGIEVAASIANLYDPNVVPYPNGPSSQIALLADGKFTGKEFVATATYSTGAYASDNCNGFTSTAQSLFTRGSPNSYKDDIWASRTLKACNTSLAFYCFEQ
jgi:hypothetical protein